jgi:hypothetical protein
MLRQQRGIIRPLKFIPQCCLETLGTNNPVTWCHILEVAALQKLKITHRPTSLVSPFGNGKKQQ